MNYILFTILFILITILFLKKSNLKDFKATDYYQQYLLNEIPIGIYIKNTNGNIIFANKEFYKISGYNINEIKSTNVYKIYPSEIASNIQSEDQKLLTENKTLNIEIKLAFENNQPHYYKVIKKPIFQSNKKLYGFIILLEKIDKEKEIEANKETFIANLAHDLKSPTYAQINTLNLLSKGTFGALSSQQQEMIELTKQSCTYLADLISTILDTYRFHNGKITLNPENINLNQIITLTCKDFEKLAREKNQIIRFKTPNDIFITADKLQLKRVISNILSNAIQYGFPNSTIDVNLNIKNSIIEFSVSNKSKPISNKELTTIFDEFNKTSMSHFNNASTGLGLHLTKQIIEMHKGKMFAYSKDDGTCTFGFTIPTSNFNDNNIKIAK